MTWRPLRIPGSCDVCYGLHADGDCLGTPDRCGNCCHLRTGHSADPPHTVRLVLPEGGSKLICSGFAPMAQIAP